MKLEEIVVGMYKILVALNFEEHNGVTEIIERVKNIMFIFFWLQLDDFNHITYCLIHQKCQKGIKNGRSKQKLCIRCTVYTCPEAF